MDNYRADQLNDNTQMISITSGRNTFDKAVMFCERKRACEFNEVNHNDNTTSNLGVLLNQKK